jgi:hypothetical protein
MNKVCILIVAVLLVGCASSPIVVRQKFPTAPDILMKAPVIEEIRYYIWVLMMTDWNRGLFSFLIDYITIGNLLATLSRNY